MAVDQLSSGVQVLHKTVDILEALRRVPDGLALGEISTKVAMPKPTVYRILATLESRGYLERSSSGSYRLSRKLFGAPRDATVEQRILRAAGPVMERLSLATGETLNLGVLDGGEVLVIETVESQQSVRMSSKIGNRRYPHSTALGKVLIADMSEREMLRLVRAKGMPAFTARTITTEKAIIVELERVRTQGFALDSQENEQHGRCIAAPVFDAEHNVVAALSISGPLPRMKTATAKAMLPQLMEACQTIMSAAWA